MKTLDRCSCGNVALIDSVAGGFVAYCSSRACGKETAVHYSTRLARAEWNRIASDDSKSCVRAAV